MGNSGGSNKKEEKKQTAEVKGEKEAQQQEIKITKAEKIDTEQEDRDKLVRIAATFLANPNIEKESLELKVAFLKRKRLNDDMIKKAFDMYKDKIRMQQEEKELKEELESIKSGSKSKQSMLS